MKSIAFVGAVLVLLASFGAEILICYLWRLIT